MEPMTRHDTRATARGQPIFAPARVLVAVLVALLCLMFSVPVAANTTASITITEKTRSANLSDRVRYFAEPEEPLSVESLHARAGDWPWQAYDGSGALSLGYQSTGIWLKLDLDNRTDQPREMMLEITWPLLDKVDFYRQTDDGWHHQPAGQQSSPQSQPLAHRSELMPLPLPPESSQRVYIRLETGGSMTAPLYLWSSDTFLDYDRRANVLLGLFFGAMIIMFFYNLFLAMLTRDPTYFAYVAYVAAVILFQANVTGFGGLYVWGGADWFKPMSYGLLASFGFATATLFAIRFLELKKNSPLLYRTACVLMAFWVAMILASPLVPRMILGTLGFPMGLITCVIAFSAAVYLSFRGVRSARYFVIAWTFLIIGASLYIGSMAGLLPRTPVTEYAQSVGSLMEVVLLSFALAERIKRTNAERNAAQAQSLKMAQQLAVERADRLKAQEKALGLQRELTGKLEVRVQERTKKLEDTLVQLEQANARLETMSNTDPLTGLYNRRYFDTELEQVLRICNRAEKPVNVMFLDVDNFKIINDEHGHGVGDKCLKVLAEVLRAHITRSGDLLARYGGEEFVLALPSTDPDQAVRIANVIREGVAARPVTVGHLILRQTVSIGVAGWVPGHDESPRLLLEAADKALYLAKERGRNRVEYQSQS